MIAAWRGPSSDTRSTGNRATSPATTHANARSSGFQRQGRTAAFEANDRSERELIDALRSLLDILDKPPGDGTLDHLWIYMAT